MTSWLISFLLYEKIAQEFGMNEAFLISYLKRSQERYEKGVYGKHKKTRILAEKQLDHLCSRIENYWANQAKSSGSLNYLIKEIKEIKEKTPFLFDRVFERDIKEKGPKKFNLLTFAVACDMPQYLIGLITPSYEMEDVSAALFLGAADKKTMTQMYSLFAQGADTNLINPETGNNAVMEFFSKKGKFVFPKEDNILNDIKLKEALRNLISSVDIQRVNNEGKTIFNILAENGYTKSFDVLCRVYTNELLDLKTSKTGFAKENEEALKEEILKTIEKSNIQDFFDKEKSIEEQRSLALSLYTLQQAMNGVFEKLSLRKMMKDPIRNYPNTEQAINGSLEELIEKHQKPIYPKNLLKTDILINSVLDMEKWGAQPKTDKYGNLLLDFGRDFISNTR